MAGTFAGQLPSNQQPAGLLQRLVCQPQVLYASSSTSGTCVAGAALAQDYQPSRPGTADKGSALVHRPPSAAAGRQGAHAPAIAVTQGKAQPWRAPPSPDAVRSSTSTGLRYLTRPHSSSRPGVSHVHSQLSGQITKAAAPATAAAVSGSTPVARSGVKRLIQQQRHVVQQAGVLSQKTAKAAQQSKRSVGCQYVDAPSSASGAGCEMDTVGMTVIAANAAAAASRASSAAAADCQAQTDQAVAVQAVMVTATAAAVAHGSPTRPASQTAHAADDVDVPPHHQASSTASCDVTAEHTGSAAGVPRKMGVGQQQQQQQQGPGQSQPQPRGQARQQPAASSSTLPQRKQAAKSSTHGSAQAVPGTGVAAKVVSTVQHSSSKAHGSSYNSSSRSTNSMLHKHRVSAAVARHASESEAMTTGQPRPQPTACTVSISDDASCVGNQAAAMEGTTPTAGVRVLALSSTGGPHTSSVSKLRLPAISSRPSTAGILGAAAGAGVSVQAKGAVAHSTDRLRVLLETPPVRCSSSSSSGSHQPIPAGRLQPLQCAGQSTAPTGRPSTAPHKPVGCMDAAHEDCSGSQTPGRGQPCSKQKAAAGDAMSPPRAFCSLAADQQQDCLDAQQPMLTPAAAAAAAAAAADTTKADECVVPAAMAEQLAAAAQAAQEQLHAAFLQARSRHSAAASSWRGQQEQQQRDKEDWTASAGATPQPGGAVDMNDNALNRQLATKRAVAAQQLRDTAATLLATAAQQSEARTQSTLQHQPAAAEATEHGLDSHTASSSCVHPGLGAGAQPSPAAAAGSDAQDGSAGRSAGPQQSGSSRRTAQPVVQATAAASRGCSSGGSSPSKRSSSSPSKRTSSSREPLGSGSAVPKPGADGARHGPTKRTSEKAAATATAVPGADAPPAAAMAAPGGSLAQRILRLQQRMADAVQQAQAAVAELDGALLLTAPRAPAAAPGGEQQDLDPVVTHFSSQASPEACAADSQREPAGWHAAAQCSDLPTPDRGTASPVSSSCSSRMVSTGPLSYARNPWLAAVAAGRAAKEGRRGVGGVAADEWQDDAESSDSEDELLVSLGGMFCSSLPPDPYAPVHKASGGVGSATQGTSRQSGETLPGFHSSLPPDPYA